MAKKKGKKAMKSKRTSRKKVTAKKGASKQGSPKKLTAKKKARVRSKATPARASLSRRKGIRRSSPRERAAFEQETGPSSGGQSGDLQGLRDTESADSESVSELLEEGNAFEADVVAGVEHVEDNEEQEVHTHEVPEDDVPEEYQGKDE
jgi:hypothetical protein